MAYKFQLGEARLSGSLIQEGGVTAENSVLSGSSMTLPAGGLSLNGVAITATGAELNYLDNDNLASADFVKLAALTATAAEINYLDNDSLEAADFTKLAALTATAAELNVLDGLAQGSILIGDGDGAAAILDAKTSGQILVGNGTTATSVAVSGDIGLAANGLMTIQANAVQDSMVNDDVATGLAGDGLSAASGVMAVAVSGAVKIASDKVGITGSIAGNGLQFAGGADSISALSVQLDAANGGAAQLQTTAGGLSVRSNIAGDGINMESNVLTLDINGLSTTMTGDVEDADAFAISDGIVRKKVAFSVVRDAVFNDVSGDATIDAGGALTIGAQKVLNSMLADDAVGADELASNAVVNASVASNAAIAASKIDFNVDLGGDVTFGSQSDDTISTTGHLTVGGNLTVNGSVTSVNSTTINITSSFTFEGPADDHETILSAGTPTADITVMLPQYATAETVHMAVLADASTAASADVTAAEFALLDGGTARGTSALADGDGFMHNDGGTMKHTNVLKIAEYSYGKISSDATVDSNGALTIADNAVTLAKMAGLASGKLILGDSNGDPAAVTMSGDATLSAAGALTIAANAVEGSMLNNDVISGQTELTVNDLASTDELLVSDAGTLKRVDVAGIRKQNVVAFADADKTLEIGVNYASANPTANRTLTLPASPVVGQSVKVKCAGNMTGGNIIISRAGSQLIDGEQTITLESPFAAIEMIYVANNIWRVF